MHVLNISFIIKFLLCVCVCVYVCVCSADQSYLTLCDPAYYNPSGSSVHGIFQARILEWAPFPPSEKLSDWGSNLNFLSLLHWQVDSVPLSHLRSSLFLVLYGKDM